VALPRPWGSDDRQRLEELIREQPDATLKQLKQRGGFTCSPDDAVGGPLRRRGLTRKKKTLHADERDRPDVQQKRRSFRRKVKQIEPERLDFRGRNRGDHGDDSRLRLGPTRRSGAYAAAPGSWESVTVTAALGLDGVRAPLVFPGRQTRRPSRRTSKRCWCRNCT